MSSNVVVFMHVFKTAGQWMRGWCRRSIGEMDCQPQDSIRFRIIETQQQCDEYKNPSCIYRDKTEVIGGHLFRHWPETKWNIQKPYTFITLFRPTVDRVVSSFYYFRNHSGNKSDRGYKVLFDETLEYAVDYLLDLKRAGENLATYRGKYSSNLTRLSNYYTGWVAKNVDQPVSVFTANPNSLEIAKQWIDTSLSYAAFQNELHIMNQELPKRFGWQSVSQDFMNYKSNENKSRPKTNIPTKLKDKILELNEMDEELFQYVLENRKEINHGKIKWINPSKKEK